MLICSLACQHREKNNWKEEQMQLSTISILAESRSQQNYLTGITSIHFSLWNTWKQKEASTIYIWLTKVYVVFLRSFFCCFKQDQSMFHIYMMIVNISQFSKPTDSTASPSSVSLQCASQWEQCVHSNLFSHWLPAEEAQGAGGGKQIAAIWGAHAHEPTADWHLTFLF